MASRCWYVGCRRAELAWATQAHNAVRAVFALIQKDWSPSSKSPAVRAAARFVAPALGAPTSTSVGDGAPTLSTADFCAVVFPPFVLLDRGVEVRPRPRPVEKESERRHDTGFSDAAGGWAEIAPRGARADCGIGGWRGDCTSAPSCPSTLSGAARRPRPLSKERDLPRSPGGCALLTAGGAGRAAPLANARAGGGMRG